MRRRSFLQYSAAAGVAASVPTGLRTAWAASRDNDELFVLVQATGGWDPRLLCDPVIDPFQVRAYSTVATVGGIRYASFDLNARVTGLDATRTRALMARVHFSRPMAPGWSASTASTRKPSTTTEEPERSSSRGLEGFE